MSRRELQQRLYSQHKHITSLPQEYVRSAVPGDMLQSKFVSSVTPGWERTFFTT
jgi:hypothetical protein